MGKSPKYYAPSVDTAARILDFLSRYETKRSTLSEISSALEINKSTCLRVLKTLEIHNLVYQETETLKYSLGVGTAVLGSRASETLEYLAEIRQHLAELSEKTGLTTCFIQRVSRKRLMIVAQHEGKDEPHVILSIGNKFPIIETSYGNWVLAYLEEGEREEILSEGLKQLTEYTITDLNKYRQNLEEIKKDGYLVSIDEYYLGISGFSFPVFDTRKELLGVIAAVGLTEALEHEHIEKITAEIRTFSQRFHMNRTGGLRFVGPNL
ncbi:IclR family transcriptional regulator [Bacillus sp. B15-48]|uniref:IclR family transcriptional regulator n=1 Tax=Bacillus sp. B15-48 TaxID=1548601 RepID=UPI00193F5A59|nr:IclR family transcriptional regulator [Bacillus sp. B15-48]MBM4763370.1 helix-turn-helix domain-containing protein [Bacillus sp. B15-48]